MLAGNILGKAASLYMGKNAVFTQSYGPEARGGACTADVVISEARLHYPKVIAPQVLVLMSEDAKNTYGGIYDQGAKILTDRDLVRLEEPPGGCTLHRIPSTRLAEELGRVIVANIVMLGFLTSVTGVVGDYDMRRAILSSIPKGTEELNLKAYETGFEYGQREPQP